MMINTTNLITSATKVTSIVQNHNEWIDRLTKDNQESIDAVWIIITTFIILTMQSGFGLLESGMVSRKNEANVMVRNMLDLILGGISFWMFGYGIGYGTDGNTMTGRNEFFTNVDIKTSAKIYSRYFSQLAMATTSTTLVSGAIAERVNLKAYMLFAFIHTGIIYPFPAHWMWDPLGWLKVFGAYDFAGCSAVHISGGMSAFVACAMIGPRRNRYGSQKDRYQMASPTNVILGTFILWFGWIGFNCGSTFQMSEGLWKVAARTSVITMNGASGGGCSAIVISAILKVKRGFLLDIPQFSVGILGGLVGITAIASSCEPWEGFVIGFVGGLVANGFITLLNKCKIDDPVGAIGVHWASGCWGMIAVGIFGKTDSVAHLLPRNGLIYGASGNLLAANLVAIIAISAWAGLLTILLVLFMKYTIKFRMSEINEIRGADDVEHDIKDPLVIFQASHAFGKRIVIPKQREAEVICPNHLQISDITRNDQIFDTANDFHEGNKAFDKVYQQPIT